MQVVLSEYSVIKGYRCGLSNQTSDVEFCDFSSIKDSLSFLLSVIGRDSNHCSLVVEIVFLKNKLEFVNVSCKDLLSIESFLLALVLDLESNTIIFSGAFGRAVPLLLSEEGVILSQTKESSWKSDRVFPVGLNFDVSGLTDLPL